MKGGSRTSLTALYRPADLVDEPIYALAQVARYARVPTNTVRSWVVGRSYRTSAGPQQWEPLIQPADKIGEFLSFTNLTEVHVLGALRRYHGVPMPAIRQAIRDLREHLGDKHPLANKKMRTLDGRLFLDEVTSLLRLDGSGQLVFRDVFADYLRRIVHLGNLAVRLHPWISEPAHDSPELVAIDPRIAFGKPFLVKSGAPTAAVMDRFQAGETITALSVDLRESAFGIEQALQIEQRRAA
ncbi:MAG: hypothetical protein ABIX28_09040 [Vicinamibacterales bacterium]